MFFSGDGQKMQVVNVGGPRSPRVANPLVDEPYALM
jgi:hypothetical protein